MWLLSNFEIVTFRQTTVSAGTDIDDEIKYLSNNFEIVTFRQTTVSAGTDIDNEIKYLHLTNFFFFSTENTLWLLISCLIYQYLNFTFRQTTVSACTDVDNEIKYLH